MTYTRVMQRDWVAKNMSQPDNSIHYYLSGPEKTKAQLLDRLGVARHVDQLVMRLERVELRLQRLHVPWRRAGAFAAAHGEHARPAGGSAAMYVERASSTRRRILASGHCKTFCHLKNTFVACAMRKSIA